MTKSISKRFIILYTLLLTLIPSQGSLASICESLSDDIPVLAGGRVKPYYVLAKESVNSLFLENLRAPRYIMAPAHGTKKIVIAIKARKVGGISKERTVVMK